MSLWHPEKIIEKSAKKVWEYAKRRLTLFKAPPVSDTTQVSYTDGATWGTAQTLYVGGFPANTIVCIRYVRVKDSLYVSAGQGNRRLKISGVITAESPFFTNTTAQTYETESITEIYAKTDADGRIAVEYQLYNNATGETTYSDNREIEIWATILEVET